MVQTPLDRLKQAISWWAFLNGVIVVFFFGLMILANIAGLTHSENLFLKTLGDIFHFYFEILYFNVAVIPVAGSPTVWFITWIITGSPRFLPWKRT